MRELRERWRRERCQSRTWDIEDGRALVHVEHVGAGAHVDPGVFRPNVLDREDAVEVHSAGGELAAALTCPHKRVGWELGKVRADQKPDTTQICSNGKYETPNRKKTRSGGKCRKHGSLTWLLAVQMKFTVAPGITLWYLGSSINTSMGLDEEASKECRRMI